MVSCLRLCVYCGLFFYFDRKMSGKLHEFFGNKKRFILFWSLLCWKKLATIYKKYKAEKLLFNITWNREKAQNDLTNN